MCSKLNSYKITIGEKITLQKKKFDLNISKKTSTGSLSVSRKFSVAQGKLTHGKVCFIAQIKVQSELSTVFFLRKENNDQAAPSSELSGLTYPPSKERQE